MQTVPFKNSFRTSSYWHGSQLHLHLHSFWFDLASLSRMSCKRLALPQIQVGLKSFLACGDDYDKKEQQKQVCLSTLLGHAHVH